MNLWDIVRKVGGGIISNAVPGGALIISAVNEFLPNDKKLSSSSTGNDLQSAISGMPAAQQVEIMSKEFDVEITEIKESHSTLRAMLEHDASNPQSTRPYIAKHSFHVIGFSIVVVISMFAYAVTAEKTDMVKAIMDGWPFIVGILAPLTLLLRSYFGVLIGEKKAVLDAANGKTASVGLVSSLAGLFKRK